MSIFKRRKSRGTQIIADAISGSAARAVYQGEMQMPHLEFRFETKDSNDAYEIVIEMDIVSATKFLNSALAAHSASAPQIHHITRPISN